MEFLTSLAKVFNGKETGYMEKKNFTCLQNEKLSFQVSYFSEYDRDYDFKIESEINSAITVSCVYSLPVNKATSDHADDYYISKEPGMYPDLLRKYEGHFISIPHQTRKTFWVEVNTKDVKAGTYKIKFTIDTTNGDLHDEGEVTVEVIGARLPEQDLICTHWFHTDCLSTYYNVPVFSDKYWEIVGNYMRCAAEHGINSLLVPLFTPPLDTMVGCERPTVQLVDVKVDGDKYIFGFDKFRKWIALSKECGLKYFELSHLFTQWGAEHCPKIVAEVDGEIRKIFGWDDDSTGEKYVDFLTQFASAFKPVLKELDIEDKCLFHISDEPSDEHIETYAKCSKLINNLFGEYKIIDALSSYEFYKKGLVKTPVPVINHTENFYCKVDELWTYYCCGPTDGYFSNRFISMPSQRTRVLGCQLYKYDIKGFLQWGFNFWYSRLSRYEINPFVITDSDGAFPAGDGFIVLPGKDGTPLETIRLKVFGEALQDLRALKLLESLTSREFCEEIIGDISFNEYPHSEEWQITLREKINSALNKRAV